MKLLNNFIVLIFIGVISLLFACNNDEQKSTCSSDVKVSAINPNGDSELALLMRKMYDDADAIKKLITDSTGNISKEYIDELERIHTAIPTDENVKTPEFEAFTKLMIQQANELFANDSNKTQGFNNLVTRCVECHQRFCPGPIKKIKKLSLPNRSE